MYSADSARSCLTPILAAGIIAYVTENGRLKVLLLKRVDEDEWDWPKGLIEEKDRQFNRLWVTAKREFIEETSIDLNIVSNSPASPYWYQYQLSNAAIKKVCLFPVEFVRKPEVIVSAEHSGYAWICTEDLHDIRFPVEQQEIVRKFLSDIELQAAHGIDRCRRFKEFEDAVPCAVASVADLSNQSWYWYGSWLADEQFTYPQILSDVDLVCIGSDVPNGRVIAANRQALVDELARRVGCVVSCSVHYLSRSQSAIERSPQWTYFSETQRCVTPNTPTFRMAMADIPATLDSDRNNELARLCWYRLYVCSVGSREQAAYCFAKGLLLLPLLAGPAGSNVEFLGYRKYFTALLSLQLNATGQQLPPLDVLLSAIDEKTGRRSLRLGDEWERMFCRSVETLLLPAAGAREAEDPCGTFCRACLAMIDGDLVMARDLCLPLGASVRQLRHEIGALRSYGQSEELRLTLLCCLGALRVLLWPRHMRFASDNVVRAITEWSCQLAKIGSGRGVALALACAHGLGRATEG